MDRGVWCVTVHGIARVRHELVTKSPHIEVSMFNFFEKPPHLLLFFFVFHKVNKIKWASLVVQLVKNLPAMQETWV